MIYLCKKKFLQLGSTILCLLLLTLNGWSSEEKIPSVHGIAMHGSVSYETDFKHFDNVNPEAPKGGAVVLAQVGQFDSLNPFILSGLPAAGIEAWVYTRLGARSTEEPFSMYGWLAEKMTMPDDRSWIIFHLNPNARWHDGKPITAHDVAFTHALLKEKGRPNMRTFYSKATAQVIDTHTIKFSFDPTQKDLEIPLIMALMVVLPKHVLEGKDFEHITSTPILGSGPYQITKVDMGRSITFERVKDYWGKDLPIHRGRFNIDTIRIDYYHDNNVSLEAFKAVGYHWRQETNPILWATAYNFPAVKQGRVILESIRHQKPVPIRGFVFNMRKPFFVDRKVRQALGYAFDFEWMNKNLFHGAYVRTRSFFDNSELAATGLPSAEEIAILEPFRKELPPEVFTTEFSVPKTDGSGNLRAQLRQADDLLKQAGWIVQKGKRVHQETKQPFQFSILVHTTEDRDLALRFADNLKNMGILVKVHLVDGTEYEQRRTNFDYDMIINTWGYSLSPGNEQSFYWSTSAADQLGSRNYAGIRLSVVDALCKKVVDAKTREELVLTIKALDRVLQFTYFIVPLFHSNIDMIAYYKHLHHPPIKEGSANSSSANSLDLWWVAS